MHFEFLIEDYSGEIMLRHILTHIIKEPNSYKINSYKGLGRLPKGMNQPSDIKHQALLNDLPRILNGYGKTYQGYGNDYAACVFVICDLDNRCKKTFRQELLNLLNQCHTPPETQFCLAIEEGEAWLLGDKDAIRRAYPKAKHTLLNDYHYDSICGTWELLEKVIGIRDKVQWAEKISPFISITDNQSPSFQYFVSKIKSYL